MQLYPKNFVNFEFFTNEIECEMGRQDFSNKVIVVNATSVLIFEYQKILYSFLPYFNYHKGKSAKEIADIFTLKIRTVYNIVPKKDD